MNPEIKAKWLTALRGGEYRQATGALKSRSRFCCLGVLCDIHAKATGGTWDRKGNYLDDDKVLPGTVAEWAQLDDPNPEVKNPAGEKDNLAGMNDGGATFKELADIIEKQL